MLARRCLVITFAAKDLWRQFPGTNTALWEMPATTADVAYVVGTQLQAQIAYAMVNTNQ